MIVTDAEEKDIESLLPIASRIKGMDCKKELEFYSDVQGFELFILKEGDINIGFICLRYEEDTEVEIDYIAIDTKYEGKGYGTFLLTETINELSNSGIKKIFLEVRSKNNRAISLYEKNGFKLYRTRKNYYIDDDASCYVKEIL